MSDVTLDIRQNKMDVNQKFAEPWKITLIDTGLDTLTGGRLKRVKKYLDDTFCFTYGDGLGNINISNLVNFHKKNKTLATVTAVQPPGRFGVLQIQNEKVVNFNEKMPGDGGWINGGYFVLEPEVLDYIENDKTVWELDPLKKLANDENLSAYRHTGFWHPVDTLWDKKYLEEMWNTGNPKWKSW